MEEPDYLVFWPLSRRFTLDLTFNRSTAARQSPIVEEPEYVEFWPLYRRFTLDLTFTLDPSRPQTQERSKENTSDQVELISNRTDGGDWEYVTGWKLLIVMTAVTAACFTMLLDTSILATASPRITSDFHSLQDVGWYGSSYLLSSCALQPMTGKFYNRFGSKNTFISFLALFEFGSLLCGVSVSSDMLIIGRAIAGLGGSGLVNGALTIVAACVALDKRPLCLGIMMSVAQLGIVLGPLIGGALTQYVTWRWCFYMNLPVGAVIAIFLLSIQIPDRNAGATATATSRSTLGWLDLVDFFLFAPTAVMFLLALEWGGTTYLWNSATVIGLFCGSAGNFAVFLAWEYKRGDAAMIPFGVIKQRIVWSSCLVMAFLSANQLITSYYLSMYFQAVKGVTPILSGVSLLPGILSQMLFAVVSGALVGVLGYYLPWIIASGALSSTSSGLISTYAPATTTGIWVGYQIIGGVGRGCGLQMPIVAIQNTLNPAETPTGMALVSFSQTFGGALFLSFAQTTFNNGLLNALRIFAPEVKAQTVINAGATGLGATIPKASRYGVILAYNQAVSHAFYLAAGAAAAAFFCSWGMGWRKVKKEQKAKREAPGA